MDVQNNLYFKDVFTLGPSFKKNFTVSLTSNSITYESKSAKTNQNVHLEDVIGATVTQSINVGNRIEWAYIHIFSYPLRKRKFCKEATRHRVEYVFAVSGRDNSSENLKTAEKWVRCIKWLLIKNFDVNLATKQDHPPRRQYLIFINPFGGKGSARKLFDKKVKPMLDEADVHYELKVTEYMGHAKEIIQSMEVLKTFDCIVCCSGDGIINEVINGLMSRPDWQEAIKTPIGHIPCGSGNGLCAASLHHSGEPFDMISAVFTVLTGEDWPLDILKAQTPKPEPHYSFLSIVFGIVADVDIESEKYRYMGDFRFSFMAIKKIMQKQPFSGKLWYLPVDNNGCVNGTSICNSHGESDSHGGEICDGTMANKEEGGSEEQRKLEDGHLSYGNLKDGVLNDGILDTSNSDHSGDAEISDGTLKYKEESSEDQRNLEDGKLDDGILNDGILDKSKSDPPSNGPVEIFDVTLKGKENNVDYQNLNDGKLNHGSVSDGVLRNGSLANGKSDVPNLVMPDFHEPIPESWKVIEGDFIGWLFISTSHIGKDVFCAPEGIFGDGVIHCMCLNGDITRSDLFDVLAKLESGEHLNVHGVHMLKARAFRIEPYSESSKVITIDGERLEWGKLQAEVYRGMGRVRCRRPANKIAMNSELQF